ncbi:unnamed protein product, partial [Leptidea sinapis]
MVQFKKCKLFMSLNKDDFVKCKGLCEGVYHKKCVQQNKQFMQTTIVEKKLGDLTNSVEFYAEMYQQLLEYKEESQKKIKALEQKNIYLEKCNKALEERVQSLEVKEKEKEIEIHGIEEKTNENTISVVQSVAKILNVNPDDIEDAMREGQQKQNDSRPKIIVATLKSKNTRRMWMMAKKDKKITNTNIYHNNNNDQIYINESLPKYKRQLMWMVRNKLKPKGYLYIWVQNGNILLTSGKTKTHIFAIYRPPKKNKLTFILYELQNIIKPIPNTENIILIGDTNINTLNGITNPVTTKYKNSLCEWGLQCVIPSSEVTREAIVDGRSDTSCLDHVWVRARYIDGDATSFVLETHVSDHHAVGLSLNLSKSEGDSRALISSSKDSVIRRTIISDKLLQRKFDEYDWTQLYVLECPLILFQLLCSIFNNFYKACEVT